MDGPGPGDQARIAQFGLLKGKRGRSIPPQLDLTGGCGGEGAGRQGGAVGKGDAAPVGEAGIGSEIELSVPLHQTREAIAQGEGCLGGVEGGTHGASGERGIRQLAGIVDLQRLSQALGAREGKLTASGYVHTETLELAVVNGKFGARADTKQGRVTGGFSDQEAAVDRAFTGNREDSSFETPDPVTGGRGTRVPGSLNEIVGDGELGLVRQLEDRGGVRCPGEAAGAHLPNPEGRGAPGPRFGKHQVTRVAGPRGRSFCHLQAALATEGCATSEPVHLA